MLELRVHGVNNTPPAAVLDLPEDQVAEVLGDSLAGFWRPKRPDGAPGNAGTRGRVPDRITREAYSWGGLARRSPGGGISAGSKVVAGLIAIGWTLLLPFGLANVAYWTRRLDNAPDKAPGSGPGGGLIRVFGLCLTAFLTVTLSDIGMDLVANQCFRPQGTSGSTAMVCTRLPGFLGGLASVPLSVRLAVFSLVPLAVLLGLWMLSTLSRSRYERAYGAAPVEPKDSDDPGPLLTNKYMWSRDRIVGRITHLNLAVGFTIVAACLTWPATFTTRPSCLSGLLLSGAECQFQHEIDASQRWLFATVLIAAALLLLLAAVFGWVRPTGRRPLETMWLMIVSIGVLVLAEALLLWKRPELPSRRTLPGVDGLPTILLIVMLALVVGAFFLRSAHWLAWTTAIALAGSLAVLTSPHGWARWVAVAIIVLVAATLVGLLVTKGGLRRFHGWAGAGPGILLGAALLAQGIMSSAVVLGVGDWLNGSKGASQLVARIPKPTPPPKYDTCGNLCGSQDPVLTAPLPYLLLGAVGVLALIVVVVGGLAALGISTRRPEIPAERHEGARRAVQGARLIARVAHRAEKLVGLLVVTGVLTTVAATMALAVGWFTDPAAARSTWLRPLDVTTPAIAVASVTLLGALAKGSGGGRRPLGLVWDLVSFLPRSAHPFAPPCYAERAVPELTQRVAWWLEQDGKVLDGQRRGGNRVVISAHSLGGVLSVAALMRPGLREDVRKGRVRFLTYGSQLRAYFSRIFPDLLGPTVLGTSPARAAGFWSGDPWRTEINEQERPGDWDRSEGSLTARLTAGRVVLWRSLWRPTDYLGFPVSSFLANSIDRRADELDNSGYLLEVLTHSNYPRTPQYRRHLDVLARLPVPPNDQ